MKVYGKARALAALLVVFSTGAEASLLCAGSMEKLAIVNSIEANLKPSETAPKEEVETVASFKEALRKLTLDQELSLDLLRALRAGLQKHYWHSAALPALPEYAIVKTLAALGTPEVGSYGPPSPEMRAEALKAARAFASAGRIALPTDAAPQLRDKKIALLNSIDSNLSKGPFATSEVKETIEVFTKELRALVLADEISVSTLQEIRDGLSKAGWNPSALFELRAYHVARAFAEYQGIKIALKDSGPGLQLKGEVTSEFKQMGDVMLPSPDGKWLLEGGPKGARLLSLTGEEPVALEACPPHAVQAVFLNDGKRVAVTFVDYVGFGVWDVETGKVHDSSLTQMPAMRGSTSEFLTTTSIAVSADRKYIVVGVDEGRNVFVYDTVEYRLIGRRNVRESGVSHVAFAEDGKRVLAMSGDGVRALLFDVKTGDQIRSFEVVSGISAASLLEQENAVVTASIQGTVEVWSAKDGSKIRAFETGLLAPELSPNGRWVADFRALEGRKKWRLEVWDVTTGKLAFDTELGEGYAASLSFASDSQSVAVAMTNLEKTEKQVRLFSVRGE